MSGANGSGSGIGNGKLDWGMGKSGKSMWKSGYWKVVGNGKLARNGRRGNALGRGACLVVTGALVYELTVGSVNPWLAQSYRCTMSKKCKEWGA